MDLYSLTQISAYRVTQLAVRMTAVTLFDLRSFGRQQIPSSGPALICSNHQSYLDPVILGAVFSRPISYMARESLFHQPVLGPLIRLYDAIPVQRDRIGISGFKQTLRRLRDGKMVLVFPEGTRSPDGRLGPLKPGICALMRRCRVPLLPVGIAGAFEAWPRDARWPKLHRIRVQIGAPITLAESDDLSDSELLAELAARMQACYQQAGEGKETVT